MFGFPCQFRDLYVRFSATNRKGRPNAVGAAWSIERFEARVLLSAAALDEILVQPALQTTDVSPSYVSSTPTGFTPQQMRQAYGFNQVSFSNGAIKGDGTGQTIAIVVAYRDPNIISDLATFNKAFGLPAPPSFTIATPSGNLNSIPVDAAWSLETALDVEWAHAMAPNAKILLVETGSNSLTSLMAGVDYARSRVGVSVVSMSWGTSEFSGELNLDSHFTTPAGHTPVTFVAASGDYGAPATWPATSSNVLSVGGTSLTTTGGAGTYSYESGWSGSGGGYSLYETEKSFQAGVQESGKRSTPDVAFNANPSTGVAVYSSVSYQGVQGWSRVGGTSAGTPQWAALIAVADQGRALKGQPALGNAQATLYTLPSSDFHDVTSGNNGYSAKVGYDLVTGRGSPLANLVIRDLVGATSTLTTRTATFSATSLSVSSSIGSKPHGLTDLPPVDAAWNSFPAFAATPLPNLVSAASSAGVPAAPSTVGGLALEIPPAAELRLGSRITGISDRIQPTAKMSVDAAAAEERLPGGMAEEQTANTAPAVAAVANHAVEKGPAFEADSPAFLDAYFASRVEAAAEAQRAPAPLTIDGAEAAGQFSVLMAAVVSLLAYGGLRLEFGAAGEGVRNGSANGREGALATLPIKPR